MDKNVSTVCRAIKRRLSWQRRRGKTFDSAGTQTCTLVDSGTDPIVPQPAGRASAGTSPRRSRSSASAGTSPRRSLPGPPPRASEVRAAIMLPLDAARRRSARYSGGRSSGRSSGRGTPRTPPRAADVRAAMQPLYGGDARRGATRGLTPSPLQPAALVGVVKRASAYVYGSRGRDGGGDDESPSEHLLRRRESSLPGPPPRASEVRAALRLSDGGPTYRQRRRAERHVTFEDMSLDQRLSQGVSGRMTLDQRLSQDIDEDEDDELRMPPPPRASAVARAVRLLDA